MMFQNDYGSITEAQKNSSMLVSQTIRPSTTIRKTWVIRPPRGSALAKTPLRARARGPAGDPPKTDAFVVPSRGPIGAGDPGEVQMALGPTNENTGPNPMV